MATIAFFEIHPWEKHIIKKQLKGHTLLFFEGHLTDEHVEKIKKADVLSVFIYSQITSAIIKKMPKLKLIVTRSTGYDHIALQECKKRKITVCNVPFYGENTVAEHAFALILSLSRNIHKSYLRTLQGDYSVEGVTGFDLKEKTIGIIGGGHIGMHLARMARGFGMHVRVFDIHKQPFMAELINFKYVDMNTLLKESHVVSLHAPHNEHTHHMIDKAAIAKMRKGAILINTSRGGLVDTAALLAGLQSGHLGGAGLDVIEGEDVIKEERELLHGSGGSNIEKWKALVRSHKLFSMDNVIFTPHNAFNSQEALMRILETSIAGIEQGLKGEPKYVVQ